MKTCSKCGVERNESEFHRQLNSPDGLMYQCKSCSARRLREYRKKNPEEVRARDRDLYGRELKRFQKKGRDKYHKDPAHHKDKYLKSLYGLAPGEFKRMLSEQGGVCAICKLPPTGKRSLGVDHDHKSGTIRGLLCGPCNSGIGLLKESKSNFQSATVYLESPSPNSYVTSEQARLDLYRRYFSPNFS